MRKTILGLTAALGASMIAMPAAAEARPAVSVSIGSGYGAQPYDRYGYDPYGYDRRGHYDARRHFAYGKVRELQSRVGQMRQDIRYFARQGAFERGEYRKLDRKAAKLQQRIHRMGRNGLNRGEYRHAISGIRNLRRDIQRDLRDGRRWGNYGYGYRGDRDRYWGDDDRWDRDGRWDRRYDRRDDRRYERRERDDWDD